MIRDNKIALFLIYLRDLEVVYLFLYLLSLIKYKIKRLYFNLSNIRFFLFTSSLILS